MRQQAKASSAGSTEAGKGGASSSRRRQLALVAGLAVIALLAVAAPASATTTVSLEPVTNVSYSSVQTKAVVTTDEACFCFFSFEVSTDGGTTWQPWASSLIFGPAEEKPLPVTLTGFKGGTTYKLRFQMNGVFAPGPNPEFTTLYVDPPENVSISAPPKLFSTSAELSGNVKRPSNTDASFDVQCRYEYVTNTQFTATGFEGATVAPCVPNPVKEPGVDKTVTARVGCVHPTGNETYPNYDGPCLEFATTYHVRLIAENSAPGSVVKETTFTTQPRVTKPVALSANQASDIAYRTAKVSGSVERPAGTDPALDVYCFAEYVTQAQFTEHGFENAPRSPCDQTPREEYGNVVPLKTAGPTPVTATLQGLRSGVTYHYRIAAENGGGLSTKEPVVTTFTTVPGGDAEALLEPAKTIAGYDTLTFFGSLVYGIGAEDENLYFMFEIAEVGTENWTPCGYYEVSHGPGRQYFSYEFPFSDIFHTCELRPVPNTEYKYRLIAEDNNDHVPHRSPGPGEPYPTVKTRKLETPSLTVNPVTDATRNTAHFSGVVDTNAPPGPLDALGKAAYKTDWKFVCTPECPGNEGTVQGEEGSKAISLEALELHANTYYEVKLVAHNDYYGAESSTVTFETPLVAPTVTSAAGASDGQGGYFLEGVVDSNNTKVTSCKFEYGTTATYPNTYEAICLPNPSGPNEVQVVNVSATSGQFKLGFRGQTTADLPYNATAAEVQTALRALSKIGANGVTVSGTAGAYKVTFSGGPLAGANVEPIKGSNGATPLAGGDGIGISTEKEGGTLHPVSVEAHLESLTVGSTYHFRIVATGAGGTNVTQDRIFIPKAAEKRPPCPNDKLREENSSGALPECRAYEMVSSPFKVGFAANLSLFGNGSQSVAGGFFSDGEGTTVRYASAAPDIAGSGSSSVFINPYLATRTSTGWETIANRNGPTGSLQSDPLKVQSAMTLKIAPDQRTELAVLTRLGEGESLHLRYADGHIAQASRVEDEQWAFSYLFIGASNDLEHSFYQGLFQSFGKLGPGIHEFSGLGDNASVRVDLNNAGEPATNCGFFGSGREVQEDQGESVSGDGRVLVFVSRGCKASPGSDFVPNFENNQIWARVGMPGSQMSYELSRSQCTRLAGDPGGACNAPADVKFEHSTPSGSRVFFSTTQQLVNADTDETRDLYACDIPPTEVAPVGLANPCPSLTLVSGADTGADVEGFVQAAADGKTVYFLAKGILADNEDALGETPEAGNNNLYVWRQDEAHPAGQTTFIGALAENELSAQTTPSGGDLLFVTKSRLVVTDNDTARDAYRYDLASDELTRVSTAVSGTGGNGEFDARILAAGPAASGAISDDGSKIVFNTEEALSPLDGNRAPDSYLWSEGEPEDGHVKGQVSLISTGAARGGSNGAMITGSGKDVYFETPAALVPADVDLLPDVYDARIDGGFPNAPSACSVAAETCNTPPTPAPTPGNLPGSMQPGPENPPPAKKTCPKGKVLKKGKCVKKTSKKPKKHKKSHHKRAGSGRGGSK